MKTVKDRREKYSGQKYPGRNTLDKDGDYTVNRPKRGVLKPLLRCPFLPGSAESVPPLSGEVRATRATAS